MAQDGPDVRPHRHLPRGALASLNRRAAAERDHCGGKADICRIRDWHVRKMCANQASDSAICCTHSSTAAQFFACAVELSLSLSLLPLPSHVLCDVFEGHLGTHQYLPAHRGFQTYFGAPMTPNECYSNIIAPGSTRKGEKWGPCPYVTLR